MHIEQVLPPRPTEYQKKCRRIDLELLKNAPLTVDVTLIYGKPPVSELPEAVERYDGAAGFSPADRRPEGRRYTIASFRRRSILPLVEQTMARIHRTREDIDWLLLDEPPNDFASFDVWVDPAVGVDDRDGFVAEAQVAGKIVVATRTPINITRLEKGRTGLLVPAGDANELTHAILAALFKPEVSQPKLEAAKQTISKYHPRQRLRALMLLLNA
ncbi:MAG TPA: glycosyltransferase [Thermoanaerobaculia bacterium]